MQEPTNWVIRIIVGRCGACSLQNFTKSVVRCIGVVQDLEERNSPFLIIVYIKFERKEGASSSPSNAVLPHISMFGLSSNTSPVWSSLTTSALSPTVNSPATGTSLNDASNEKAPCYWSILPAHPHEHHEGVKQKHREALQHVISSQ
jgi:hypothetical protein